MDRFRKKEEWKVGKGGRRWEDSIWRKRERGKVRKKEEEQKSVIKEIEIRTGITEDVGVRSFFFFKQKTAYEILA